MNSKIDHRPRQSSNQTPEQHPWIPMRDALPAPGDQATPSSMYSEPVEVQTEDRRNVSGGRFIAQYGNTYDEWVMPYADNRHIHGVTHWRPLTFGPNA